MYSRTVSPGAYNLNTHSGGDADIDPLYSPILSPSPYKVWDFDIDMIDAI